MTLAEWREKYLPPRRIYYSGLLVFMAGAMVLAKRTDLAILNVLVAIWVKIP